MADNLENLSEGNKERLKFLESTIGDNAEKHNKGLEDTKEKITDLHCLLAHCQEMHASLKEEVDYQADEQESIGFRLKHLATCLGDSDVKHQEELKRVEKKHNNLAGGALHLKDRVDRLDKTACHLNDLVMQCLDRLPDEETEAEDEEEVELDTVAVQAAAEEEEEEED